MLWVRACQVPQFTAGPVSLFVWRRAQGQVGAGSLATGENAPLKIGEWHKEWGTRRQHKNRLTFGCNSPRLVSF